MGAKSTTGWRPVAVQTHDARMVHARLHAMHKGAELLIYQMNRIDTDRRARGEVSFDLVGLYVDTRPALYSPFVVRDTYEEVRRQLGFGRRGLHRGAILLLVEQPDELPGRSLNE